LINVFLVPWEPWQSYWWRLFYSNPSFFKLIFSFFEARIISGFERNLKPVSSRLSLIAFTMSSEIGEVNPMLCENEADLRKRIRVTKKQCS